MIDDVITVSLTEVAAAIKPWSSTTA